MEFKNNYEVVDCDKKMPTEDGFYYTIDGGRTANNWFKNVKWLDEILSGKPTGVTHWLREMPSSVVLTEAELKKIIEDSFDECDKYKSWVTDSELEQKKKQYIEQFFKSFQQDYRR